MCSPSRLTPHSSDNAAGFCGSLEPVQAEPLNQVRAEQLLLLVARELEDPAAAGDDPPVLVADHERGVRRGVVVVHQLEQKPEAAALAGDRHVVDLLEPVVVD